MRTQDARNIHINDYLARIGAKPVRSQRGTNGIEYVYRSPVREDNKPSLCVNLERNIWSDVPAGEGGRLIELVCYLNDLPKTDVAGALKVLDQLFPQHRDCGHTSIPLRTKKLENQSVMPFSTHPQVDATSLKEEPQGNTILKIQEIHWYPLKNYLKERRISESLARKYLKEIRYRTKNGHEFSALGWKSGETYVLRNAKFKGFLGKGADISIFDEKTPEIYVFEGFFDYLTYLMMKKRQKMPLTAIVLNSTVMYTKFKNYMAQSSNIQQIHCFFDNDTSGKTLISNIQSDFPHISLVDHAHLYENFNDLNDWYVSQ